MNVNLGSTLPMEVVSGLFKLLNLHHSGDQQPRLISSGTRNQSFYYPLLVKYWDFLTLSNIRNKRAICVPIDEHRVGFSASGDRSAAVSTSAIHFMGIFRCFQIVIDRVVQGHQKLRSSYDRSAALYGQA